MKRVAFFACALGSLAATVLTPDARAAQTRRVQVDQHGDFRMIGNTLGYDCGPGVVAPVVGTVGPCGMNTGDDAPDVFWRSEQPNATSATASTAITLAQARSTAILSLPTGATVTHAFLYWAARRNGAGGDNQVTLDRPGGFTSDLTATQVFTTAEGTDTVYESVADVTTLVKAQGVGAYRVSGVDATNFVNLNQNITFAGWNLVVFYSLPTDPVRNLALFDGLDAIQQNTTSDVALTGFLVPTAGFDAKLGVLTYEGDDVNTGDSLLMGTPPLVNADRLTDAQNPVNNFFNGTRSFLGTAVSVAGDLPQLTGGPRSMSSVDMDVVNVTPRLAAGQSSVTIRATTTQDVFYLGAFVTSISTFNPDFTTSTKTVADLNGGSIAPGDVLEYTVNVTNTGNDAAVGVVVTDAVPTGLTYVPNSTTIDGAAKTDAAGDDQVTFNAGNRTITARVGAGADAGNGGALAVNGAAVVKFRVTVDATASGTISNQANITASGLLGGPSTTTPTDGNGGAAGRPPTDVSIDQCTTNAQCSGAKPVCDTSVSPKVCVGCLNNTQCSTNAPVCNTTTKTCGPCASDANCPAALPACLSSGACGLCSGTNATKCTGATPVCNTATATCVGCLTNANCSGATPVCNTTTKTCTGCTSDSQCGGAAPACLPGGACGQCSATNQSACTGAKPVCDVQASVCVGCLTNANCSGTKPVCAPATKTCVGCTSDANCAGATPACQPSGACGQCSASNQSACTGANKACNAATGTCTGCATNADCPVTAPQCTPATGVCSCPGAAGSCVDTDNDGITDVDEGKLGTDPSDADSDDDGVQDGKEPDFDKDTDNDGAINALDPDSDNDGLYDGTELGLQCTGTGTNASRGHCRPDADNGATKTDPLLADTDGGGARDGSEDVNLNGAIDSGETDPTSGHGSDDATVIDTDQDHLSDGLEKTLGSNAEDADSDDDGVPDGEEANPSEDVDLDGLVDVIDVDSDNDAIFDGTEVGKACNGAGTDAAKGHCIPDGDTGTTVTSMILADTDRGGARDGSEDANRNGVKDTGEQDPTATHGADDGTIVDTDKDGLSDATETSLGSDPNDADTDDDGITDGSEANPSDDGDADGKIDVKDEDSDGDGILDGTERGQGCGNPATSAAANHCVADADPQTTTSMVNPDTDRGGVKDGDEDANQNGRIDNGETDPNDAADDFPGDGGAPDGGGGGAAGAGGTAGIDAGPDGALGGNAGAAGSSGSSGASGAGGTGGSGGAAGAAASAGTAGEGGEGGASGATGTGATGHGAGGSSVARIEGGGCSCELPRQGRSPSEGLAALAAIGLGLAARRRRKGSVN
jgi:uncharacterized repeat protein (TIGR01451 family)/MYXO-CTERM domain-containing protein